MSSRIVITGMGAVTGIGIGKEQYFDALCAGCRIDSDSLEVEGFKASDYMTSGSARKMSKVAQYAVAAAKMAIADALLSIDDSNRNNFGVIMGSAFGAGTGIDKYLTNVERMGGSKASPLAFTSTMHQESAAQICLNLGIKGFHTTLATMGSGLAAIIMGMNMIKNRRADIVLAGGAEEINQPEYDLLKALKYACGQSQWDRSVPFDHESRGCRLGCGAAIIVMEDMEHAIMRGAPICAEIVGAGASMDTAGLMDINPSGHGIRKAINAAIIEAGSIPEAVQGIFASANGYGPADMVESAAIKTIFNSPVPITAIKSATGECFGASGALSVITAAMSVRRSVMPFALNGGQAVAIAAERILINSLYPGGENAALIIKK